MLFNLSDQNKRKLYQSASGKPHFISIAIAVLLSGFIHYNIWDRDIYEYIIICIYLIVTISTITQCIVMNIEVTIYEIFKALTQIIVGMLFLTIFMGAIPMYIARSYILIMYRRY